MWEVPTSDILYLLPNNHIYSSVVYIETFLCPSRDALTWQLWSPAYHGCGERHSIVTALFHKKVTHVTRTASCIMLFDFMMACSSIPTFVLIDWLKANGNKEKRFSISTVNIFFFLASITRDLILTSKNSFICTTKIVWNERIFKTFYFTLMPIYLYCFNNCF